MRTTTLLRSGLAAMMVMLCSAVGATDAPKVNTSALSTYDKNAPIGFGASITGSGDENPVTVATLAELTAALTGTDAKTIYVSGTITFTGLVTIESAQDKTVYGLPGAELVNPTHTATVENTGILTLKNCNNIIIRNITFKGAGAYDIDGNDNLTLSGSTNIWIDHCDFQDGVDGNLDCNNGSDNICVSWCRFRYLISPWSGGSGGSDDHRFSNLWGGGDGNADKDEGKLNTTFYACWWDNGCKQRMPRVRFGKVHILNCLYSSSVADYCIGAGYKSNLYVENSVFNVSSGKAWHCYATESGYTDYNIKLVGNSGAADDTKSSGSITQFEPTYNYTAIAASDVQAAVTAANGAGATLTYGDNAHTVYKWEAGTETGGTAVASGGTDSDSDITNSYIRLKGANDFSTNVVTISFDKALHAGDLIYVTAYRNKNVAGKTSGFKAKFGKGSSTVASSTGLEFVNIHSDVSTSDEYGTEANTCTFTVPDDAEGSKTMTMTRSHTATNLFITKLEITSTVSDSGEEEPTPEAAIWRNFSAIVNNQSGTLLTTEEQVQGTALSFGIAVAEDGTVSRVAADDASSIATISGTYHSEHGMTGMTVVTAVPGAVKILVGQCTFSSSAITVTNSNGEIVATTTPATACWKNDRNNVTELIYDGDATTLTITGMGYCPFIAVEEYVAPAEFRDFSAIVNNQSGTLLTTAEQVENTAINFGIAVAEDGTVSRVAADDASSIATISGKYHSEHGLTGMKVVTAVPGSVKILVGQCTFSSSAITVTNSNGEVVATTTPATACWKNDRNNVTELIYSGEATTLTITGMGYCPFVAVMKSEASEEPEPTPTPGEGMTITWSMANGAASSAVANPAADFQTTSWSVASDLAINGNATGTYGTSTYTLFTRNGTEKLSNDRSQLNNSYVEFLFKPAAGITVTPTGLSFDIIKVGTGDPNIWVECVQGATTTSIAQNVAINRDNGESPSVHHDYDLTALTDIAATTDETAIRIYIGKLANNKQVGIANVVVSGTVTGSIQNFTTVYDLATAMMSETNNFEGNTGSLAPTTAEADANAPSILVDATSGKLGKNNNDWAQLNAGTMLTIPGVPEGAQVTFALYNTTALTIDGVAYTNGQTFTATKDVNLNMTCTTGGYIKSITVEGPAFVEVSDNSTYTNTWYFGKSNGAPEFALQKSAEYTYTVEGYSLVINTDAGKLNNARADQWAQCNDGTTFKVPVFEGSKLTWGRYNGGSESGFTIDGQLYPEYYIATEEGTVNMTAKGISYLSYIKIEPATLYEITGTVSGGDINGQPITFTATGNGQPYSATVAENAFTLKVPAGKYTIDLTGDAPYVVSSPLSVDVDQDAAIGEVTVTAALPQQVTGHIVNAPAEAFTLTFTATNNASHTQTVNCSAGETAYNVTLDPDTYTISSDKGTLSPLSQESFKVLKSAVQFGIYYPEAAVPAATQQNITVDNTAAVAANVYNTVTDALAAAKAGNISKPIITLTSNQTYREQVIVDQADVTLKTSGEDKATITFYYGIGYAYYSLGANGYYDKDRAMTRHSIKMIDPARWGASVLVTNKGNNFRAENIVFENSFNRYYTDEEVLDGVTPNGVQSISYDRTLTDGKSGYLAADAKAVTERAAAIAFENNPTGVELYNCTFIGSQDTYYTSGTMYVKDCNIVGNTDYIFGGGYVVFDNCDLTIGGYSDKETSAYITAYNGNGRYIFRDCTVKSGGRTYVKANLGRDWGGTNASVYYFNLKNEIGNKLEYKWQNMGGAVSAGTADLHIYDFDPTVNANYSTTGPTGANINGVLNEADALTLYGDVVTSLGFTPERIYADVVELSESSAYNKCRIAASDEATRNVTLTRSITGGNWSTICLPFGMTADQVTATFGTDTKLATFRSYNSDTKEVTTASATTIAANTPCFIKVADNVSEGTTIEGVTFVSGEPEIVIDGDFKYVGVYSQTDMASGDFFLANNKLYKATENTSAIKPFRAYFTGVPANARILFTDGEATRIDATLMGGDSENGDVYDLQGRRVERPVKKGLYINGGRKVIIK